MRWIRGLVVPAVVGVGVSLGGCSSAFIEERPMAWNVLVVDPARAGQCKPLGGVKVSVVDKVWLFDRTDPAVEADLLKLARNDAIDAGGDTLVKGDSPERGTRNFSIYKCGP